MSRLRAVYGVTIAVCLAAMPVAAKDKEEAKAAPKIFQDVIDCRTIGADAERLACYDSKVASLETAQQSKELFVADKEEVKKSRRGLFGLALPNLGIFGDDDEDEEVVKEVEAIIRSAREVGGRQVLVLDNGAVWVQTDDTAVIPSPKPDQKVKIRRAALGSYLASVEGRRSFRVKRRVD